MPVKPRITVLGSINLDLVAGCSHLPQPGETIIASSFSEVSGGKGANQAVAAARWNAEVKMIGRQVQSIADAEQAAITEAVRYASAAGAIAASRAGAQPAMPSRAEVIELLERAGDTTRG